MKMTHHRRKTLLALLLCAALILPVLPCGTALAETVGGTCEDGLTWSLTDDGTLTISGSGAMKNYDPTSDRYTSAPWGQYNDSVKKLIIQDGVTSIGEYAFSKMQEISAVSIPSSVTSIGNHAFDECKGLNEITIPSSVTSIGYDAFAYCSNLKKITILSSLISIGDNVFKYCTSLTEVTLPEGIETISPSMFQSCKNLSQVYIPSTVTSIGMYAFNNCFNLSDIRYNGTEEEWDKISKATDPAWDTNAGMYVPGGYKLHFLCTVKFNANGHGQAPGDIENSWSNETISAPSPAPSEEHYTFTGWYKEAACENIWDFDKDTVTGDITLYAGWTINAHDVTYTVTNSPAGAPSAPDKTTEEYNAEVSVAKPLSMEGYDFSGWTTKDVTVVNNKFTMPDKAVVFTGNWTPHTHDVTYTVTDAPAGTPSAPDKTTEEYNTEVSVAGPLSFEGYDFSGWTTKDVTVVNNKFTMPDKAVTFTGSWTVHTHTLTIIYEYKADGSQAAETYSQLMDYGAQYKVPSPAVTGYLPSLDTVSGTMGDEDVEITVTYDANTYKLTINYRYADGSEAAEPVTGNIAYKEEYAVKSPVIKGYTADKPEVSGTMGDQDVTVTVTYTVNSHQVSYKVTGAPDGAPSAPAAATAAYGTEVKVADPLTLAGYTFSGWTTADVTVSDGKFTMPDQDVTFTGSWEKDPEPSPDPNPSPDPEPSPDPSPDSGIEEKVTLKKIKISKTKSLSNHKAEISWKKLSKKQRKAAKMIEIQVCARKDFKNGVITKKVKSKKTSAVISGLKKGQKYYVRIRAYTEDGNIRYVSKWSKAKSFTIIKSFDH